MEPIGLPHVLPISLVPSAAKIGLIGQGEALARRAALLAEAGIEPVAEGYTVLFIAGLSTAESARLTREVRAQGVLVNVEDVPALCDFHVPAIIRRGDLLLTVSTGGQSPGLARMIREWLERRLGLEWSGRLREVAQAREQWRRQGSAPADVAKRTRAFVEERAWLP